MWALNFPSWSVSVEFAVSLLFFFYPLADHRVRAGAALAAIGTAVCLGVALTEIHAAKNLFKVINVGLVIGVGWFAIGYAAFLLSTQFSGYLRCYSSLTPYWFAALIPLLMMPQSVGATAIFCIVVLAALAFGAVNDRKTFLTAKPFIFLGTISYSIYLLHMPAYWTFEALLGEQSVRGLLGKSWVIASILGLSTLSYYYFELPAKRALLAILPRLQTNARL